MRIISTSSDIKCHNWLDGTLHSSYRPPSTSTHINTVSWAKDNGWIVLVPNKGYAEIVSFDETPKSLLTIKEVQYPTCACFPNSTKRNVALGTSSGRIMIYDVKKREIKKKFPYGQSTFFKLEFTPNDKYVVAGCENGMVCIYNSVLSSVCGSFKVPKSRTLTNFQCHPVKVNYVSACSEEGIVCLWDLNRSKSLLCNEAHKLPATDLAFVSFNFDLLASVGMDRNICLHDVRKNKAVYSGTLKKSPTVINCSADGVSIAIGFQDGQIDSYDLRKMNETVLKFKHNEMVKNIIFERNQTDSGSVISLHGDDVEIEKNNHTQDSFEQILFNSPSQGGAGEGNPSKVNDSFFEALVFTPTSTSEDSKYANRRISDGVLKLMNLKPNLLHSHANNSTEFKSPTTPSSTTTKIKTKTENCLTKTNIISTPVLTTDSNFPAFQVSPIDLKQKEPVNQSQLKEIVREVVREEMDQFKKDILEVLMKEVKFSILDVMRSCTRQHHDMHWYNMAEFNSLGEKLDKLREDLECNNCADSGCSCH